MSLSKEAPAQRTRHSLFPIQYPKIWAMVKAGQASTWRAEDVDMSRDRDDWRALAEPQRHYLSHTLAFFAKAENDIMEALIRSFMEEAGERCMEAQHFYAWQLANEAVHTETYHMMIEALMGDDPAAKDALLELADEMVTVTRMREWARRWLDPDKTTFAERVVAMACIEGIFFVASFGAIYWVKLMHILLGLCAANNMIAQNETLHRDMAIEMFNGVLGPEDKTEAGPKRVREIVESAVDVVEDFVREALPVRLLGMNADLMCRYVRWCANDLSTKLGAGTAFDSGAKGKSVRRNPFPWMLRLSVPERTTFLEARNTTYQVLSADRPLARSDPGSGARGPH